MYRCDNCAILHVHRIIDTIMYLYLSSQVFFLISSNATAVSSKIKVTVETVNLVNAYLSACFIKVTATLLISKLTGVVQFCSLEHNSCGY